MFNWWWGEEEKQLNLPLEKIKEVDNISRAIAGAIGITIILVLYLLGVIPPIKVIE